MKILNLSFKNLNSLYGEWHVDFEAKEYGENMIFALTGPTGAGKTTILDAICLGLYGRTPRLGPITVGSNEIMSRGTGECWAEVTFLTKKGLFKSRWEQRRARGSHGGNLQGQKHRVFEVQRYDGGEFEGKLIAETVRESADKIVEVVGMSFEQFTKAVMLAQGEFNTFLKANNKDKSSILEQITGTKIYTELSVLAHVQTRDFKVIYEREKSLLENIKILTTEEEKEKLLEREALNKLRQEQLEAQKNLEKSLNWRLTMDKLEKEIADLAMRKKEIEKSIADFFPNKKRLELAKLAGLAEGSYATYMGAKEALKATEAGIGEAEKALKAAGEDLSRFGEKLKAKQGELSAVQKAHEEGLKEITGVRLLDNSLRSAEKQWKERGEELKEVEKNRGRVEADLAAVRKGLQAVERLLEKGHGYEKEHEKDGALTENLGVLENRLEAIGEQKGELEAVKKALAGKRGEWDALEKNLKKLLSGFEGAEGQLKAVKKQEEAEREALAAVLGGKSLEELRAEEELARERYVKAQTVASLEEHRAGLREGEACPLCGALEHPFGAGAPEVGAVKGEWDRLREVIRGGERCEGSLKKLREKHEKALAKFNEIKLGVAKGEGELKGAEKEVGELEKKVAEGEGRLKGRIDEVNAALLDYGVQIEDGTGFEELLEGLRGRRRAWQENEKELKENEKDKVKLVAEVEGLDKRLVELRQELEAKAPAVKKLEAEYEAMRQKRVEIFGEKNPDKEEEKLKIRLGQAVAREEKARMDFSKKEKEVSEIGGKLGEQRENLAKQKPALEKAWRGFEGQVLELGFEDEKGFLEARLDGEVQRLLEKEGRELENLEKENTALAADKSRQLQLEQAKALTEEGAKELGAALEAAKEAYGQTAEGIGKLGSELEANRQAKEAQAETLKQVEAAQVEYLRWAELSDLIGAADGSKFRKFAQSLTFELLVQKANQQLALMMPRYILKNGGEDRLELFVVDNYQGGEVRSTDNLSGGEGFIVCLALALGLANMTGQQVNVDSLFLDEGFGTLDENSLATALDSLSGLMQKGKIIGIISHVAEIKQRIPNQIEIKSLNGRSQMSGSGVTRGAA
jgi:exonuclease SbcC